MNAQRQQDLWAIAIENFQAAWQTAQQGRHNVSIACSYYAVYTAIWAALDNAPQGQWSHAGILQHFSSGRWRQSSPPLDRTLTQATRRLYNARVHAQYMGERLRRQDSGEGLHTTRQIMQLVAMTIGFSFGGRTP
jgi:uncharacterized protein (UPF0332 family)